jgi:hypothetical protein
MFVRIWQFHTKQSSDDYEALDRTCGELTAKEAEIGAFLKVV